MPFFFAVQMVPGYQLIKLITSSSELYVTDDVFGILGIASISK